MTEIIPGSQGDILNNSRKGVPFLAGQRKVAACAKHFVGDGETNKGVHENNTIISSLGLFSIHMPAYYNSIIKGVATVMIAYSSWNGDASLVRIMKSRKVLGQHQLLTECVEQINHMFKRKSPEKGGQNNNDWFALLQVEEEHCTNTKQRHR
ncbi:uncharacterized protein LOC108192593 [Daucus carota subsp. sativus]|uniref:uncharacterized protein LOC108192593 n=1 Tax=Daucus carota subsp. sativus TaxID=79200 RepID=UPI003082BBD0